MNDSILITGASGFLGYHLVDYAVRAGYQVYAAVRPSSEIDHLAPFNIRYLNLDYGNVDSLRKMLEEANIRYVIHAAGTTKAKDASEYNRINAEYTKNLAIAASGLPGLKKFIFVSSLAALGPIPFEHLDPIEENHTPKPVTNYGRSKLLAESYLKDIKGLPLLILRPTAIYGPREKDIFIMFKTLNKGFEPYIGRVNQWLTFVYATDLAELIVRSLSYTGDKVVFNISDGKKYDRYALAKYFKHTAKKKTLKFHIPMPLVKMVASIWEATSRNKVPALNKEKLNELAAENWNCSIESARRELAFDPKYDLERGMTETTLWYIENKWI